MNTTLESTKSLFELSQKFEWPEYLVFASVLVLSAAIGIFYGCFGSKQDSNEEYLMGNRQMSAFPVALSLLCSFISAIALLGYPAEIYLYGSQFIAVMLCFIPLTLALNYFYVPVYFNLQLTSAYEYFELRYSRAVRVTVSLVSIAYLILYMSIVVFGPSIALNQVTGFNKRLLSAVIFLVCIFYSTLGGFKAVLWTDTLQAIIMVGSLGAVVIKGVIDVGGWDVVWSRAEKGGRIEFLNFDMDPRARYTVWSVLIGGYFSWLPIYAATQANIQRFVSMPDLKTVRRSLMINLVGLYILMGFCFYSGLVIFAKYHDCDPISSGGVDTSDKLLPYFVMDILGDYKGVPGLFVAGITCAGLSSVSSGLNALAAIITEDYIKKWKPNLSDKTLSKLSKAICVITGLISFGFVFLAELVGNIFPATVALLGMIMGPTLGMFSLGMFFPWANTKGTLSGLASSFILMIFFGVGSIIARAQGLISDQRLPVTTNGCYAIPAFNRTMEYDEFMEKNISAKESWKDKDESILVMVLSISYLWTPFIGFMSTILFGLLFSFLFSCNSKPVQVNVNCISPPFLWLWRKLFPGQMKQLIKLGNEISTENSLKSVKACTDDI